MSGFLELLENTTAIELVDPQQEVISVSKTTTVEETLQVLDQYRVLSVPVEDSESPAGFCDFVDVLDIVASLVDHCKDLNNVQVKVETFSQQPIIEVVNMSNKDPFVTVTHNSKATTILDYFASGVHRLGVTNDEGKIVKVISQMDFLRFAKKNLDKFKEKASQSVKELGLVNSWVLFIRKSERSLVGYKKMIEHAVSAVCVVDETGKLESFLSASVLRGLTAETFGALRLPVESFLAAQKVDHVKPFTCVGEDSFAHVLSELVDQSIHRLWIENAAGLPVGVISLTDVCVTLRGK